VGGVHKITLRVSPLQFHSAKNSNPLKGATCLESEPERTGIVTPCTTWEEGDPGKPQNLEKENWSGNENSERKDVNLSSSQQGFTTKRQPTNTGKRGEKKRGRKADIPGEFPRTNLGDKALSPEKVVTIQGRDRLERELMERRKNAIA